MFSAGRHTDAGRRAGGRRLQSRAAPLAAALTTAVAVGLLLGPTPATGAERGTKPVRSLLELRREGVVTQQWDLSCGAAALATLLAFQHGDPVPERVLAEAMVGRDEYLANAGTIQARGGFSLLDLKRAAEARGYQGIGYGRLALDDLVNLGPTIVPVALKGYYHFVVFRAVRGGRVLLADPAFGNRTMPIERFLGAWRARIGFVVRRPGAAVPAKGSLAPNADDFLFPPAQIVRTALDPLA
jgi:predicted double-glycine peptidase